MNTEEYRSLLHRLSDASDLRRQLVYSCDLRDALHAERARCGEEGRPFPAFSKELLSHVEEGIQDIQALLPQEREGPKKRGLPRRGASRHAVRSRSAPPTRSAP